jgi:hypothetical protein
VSGRMRTLSWIIERPHGVRVSKDSEPSLRRHAQLPE